jgi:hypothetical protein
MTTRASFTKAQIERAIRAADATGKVAVQTTMGIAFVDPASLPQTAPTESGENSCDRAFGCA